MYMNQPVAVNDMPIWGTRSVYAIIIKAGGTYDDCARQKDCAPSPSIHQDPCWECGKQVDDSVDPSHQNSLPANPSCLLEDNWSVVRDDINAVLSLQSVVDIS